MNPPAACRLIAGVLLSLFPMAAQDHADRVILEAEQAREAGLPALLAAKGGVRSQMLAARAIGRLENPDYRDVLIPLLSSPDPQVRRRRRLGTDARTVCLGRRP
jgi:HEAT repeat protein